MGKTVFFEPRNEYEMVENHIVCKTDKPGKISGTSLGAILGEHPYKSEFSAAVDLFALADADLTFNEAVNAGKVIEEPLIAYAKKMFRNVGTFYSAEQIFPARTGPHNEWAPDFEHPVFTGHIDGAIITDEGEQYVLEVKTTKNSKEWFIPEVDAMGAPRMTEDGRPIWKHGGVPDHYYWQVALYNEFVPDMQKDMAYVLVGFVDEKDYDHPEKYVPDAFGSEAIKPNTYLLPVPIDREELREKLAEATEWYNTYILNGTTPDYDPSSSRDMEIWHHLMVVNSDEGSTQALIDQYWYYKTNLAPKIKYMEQLEKDYKEWMNRNHRFEMVSERGLNVVVTTQARRNLDRDRIAREFGINLDDYMTVSTNQVFTITDPTAPKVTKTRKTKAKKDKE